MAEPAESGPSFDADAIVAPERLTDLLTRAGRLAQGARVVGADREGEWTTIISRLVRVRPRYAGDQTGGPSSLLLKSVRPDFAAAVAGAGRNEAVFYRDVASFSPADALAACFDVSTGSENAACYVLLEDLSATHAVPTGWPLPPDIAACERLIDAYAGFHAAWWDDPRLGASVGRFAEESALPALLADVQRRWTAFRGLLGDHLSDERVSRYERLFEAAPRFFARFRARRNLTVVHGDAHVWNALYPHAPGATVRIIDWDSWRIGVAARDLAYMIALHWYPERRRRFERPLLRRYHDGLLAHGVAGYSWEALLEDYRASALWQLITPMWQATSKIPEPIWWSHLERGMLAFEDLDCASLLE